MSTLLVVGGGHAANALISGLSKHKFTGRIVLVGDERHPPYNRPPLSKKFLTDKMDADSLHFRASTFFEKIGVDLHLGDAAVLLDCQARRVGLASGRQIEYAKLVLATGAAPRVLPPQVDRSGERILVLRNVEDAVRLRGELRNARSVVILGAGYVGLEVAASCAGLGKKVTVVEASERVLARVAGAQLAEIVQDAHEARGVVFHLGTRATLVDGASDGCVVELNDGGRISADLVLCAIGAVPNVCLAEAASLEIDGGILTDNRCLTSSSDVFAIGDCAAFSHQGETIRLESVQNASDQAEIVARQLCGCPAEYAPIPWFWSDQYDLRLQSFGCAGNADETVLRSGNAGHSIWSHRDGRITALDTVNSPRDHMLAHRLMARGEIRLESLRRVGFDLSSLSAEAA